MDSNLQAFSSNPRYAEGGLEEQIDKEELDEARRKDSESTAVQELADISAPVPMADEPPLESKPAPASPVPTMDSEVEAIEAESRDVKREQKASLEEDARIQKHEQLLKTIETATRIPRDIAGGLNKATDSAITLIAGRENVDQANAWLEENIPGANSFGKNLVDGMAPKGTASKVTQELTQFFGPFTAYVKGVKAISMASGVQTGVFTQAMIADIAASGTALDPHMERLSTVMKSMGVENQFIGWLADNENETDSEGRLKNVIENTGIGLAAAGAITSTMLMFKGLWRGAKELAQPGAQQATEWEDVAVKTHKTETIGKPEEEAIKIEQDFLASQKGREFDESMELAEKDQTWLSGEMDKIDEKLSVFHANPGAKSPERAATKLKEGSTLSEHIKDIARGGWVTENMAQSDSLVRELAKRMPVMDEGYTVTPAGYFDRKVMIRTPDGTVAEVQVWDPVMLEAKEGAGQGHKMYEAWGEVTHRSGELKGQPLPGKEKEAEALQKQMIDLYLGSAKQMPDEAKQLYINNAEKLQKAMVHMGYDSDLTKALNSVSDKALPLEKTSGVKAGTNLPPTNDLASNSLAPPRSTPSKTDGTPSKLTKPTTLSGKSINTSLSPEHQQSVAETHRLINNYKPLPDNPSAYFTNPPKTQMVDISKLEPTRQREKGVRNAYKFMDQARKGTAPKRKPISLIDNGDGTFTVEDGNSTFANALASGWKKIPAQVRKLTDKEKAKIAKDKEVDGKVSKLLKDAEKL